MADYKAGALSKDKKDDKKGGDEKDKSHKSHTSGGTHKHPHVYIHSHDAGHTMHVMHDDGAHEMHHMAPGDTNGMQQILAAHMAGGGSPDMGGEPQPDAGAPPAAAPAPPEQGQPQAA